LAFDPSLPEMNLFRLLDFGNILSIHLVLSARQRPSVSFRFRLPGVVTNPILAQEALCDRSVSVVSREQVLDPARNNKEVTLVRVALLVVPQ
jgi:hypothetical protein